MVDPGPMRPADAVFPERRKALKANKCVFCGKDVVSLRDEKSFREYKISGLCQKCQDETFGD